MQSTTRYLSLSKMIYYHSTEETCSTLATLKRYNWIQTWTVSFFMMLTFYPRTFANFTLVLIFHGIFVRIWTSSGTFSSIRSCLAELSPFTRSNLLKLTDTQTSTVGGEAKTTTFSIEWSTTLVTLKDTRRALAGVACLAITKTMSLVNLGKSYYKMSLLVL